MLEPIPFPEFQVIKKIVLEYNEAKNKHPEWPTDPIHASAIVAEEAGELTRATLQHTYENGRLEDAEKEAIQVAVTAIRFLEGLARYQKIKQL
jgi:NTP pyrophosphatase (non-canonical NTP hydrolase)